MDRLQGPHYSRLDSLEDMGQHGRFHEQEIELDNLQKAPPSYVSPLPSLPGSWTSQSQYSAVATGQSNHEDLLQHHGTKVQTGWDPLFLRRWVLILFAVFFAGTFAAVQILLSVAHAKQGIANSDESKRLIWTYGPTALLTLATVFWRQVDYAAKYIQPWAEMAKGPASADRSLLLDYVTPFQVVAAWRALRNRHYMVMSTILIFFLLKALTIVSTGLFGLTPIPFEGISRSMLINNTFDGKDYQHGASVDTRPAYTIYGHRQFNLSYPVGTNEQYAIQGFMPKKASNKTLLYSAVVDVFTADLQCEIGKLTYNTSFDHNIENTPVMSYYNTSVSTSDCQIFNARLDAPSWYYVANDTGPRYGYWGMFQNVTCSNLAIDDNKRERYMVAIAYSQGNGQNKNTMLNSSNIVCIPTYTVQSATVTMAPSGDIQSVAYAGQPRQLEGVSGTDIGHGVAMALADAEVSIVTNENITLDAFLQLTAGTLQASKPENLLDTAWLESNSREVYKQIATQIARMYLLSPISSSDAKATIPGTVTQMDQRLIVREVPVRIMQGILTALFGLTLFALFAAPHGVVPRSVDSLAAMTAVLARSPELVSRLRQTGHLSMKALSDRLSGKHYMTVLSNKSNQRIFSIKVVGITRPDSPTFHHHRYPIEWEHPFVLRRIGMLAPLLLPIAAIITLEVLVRYSDNHSGLGDANEDTLTRYSWLYAPTITFGLLGTLFNLLDFELEFTDPYHSLARGYCNARSTMLKNPLSNVSLQTVWEALRHSNVALVASALSVIFVPFLTIVASGLFATQAVAQEHAVNIETVDWFNTTGPAEAYTVYTSPVPGLIVEGNMSYPQWTWNEFAIPQLVLQDHSDSITGNGLGTISITIPAIRGAMNCTLVPENFYANTTIERNAIQLNITTNDGCGNGGWIDHPLTWLQQPVSVPVNTSGYFSDRLNIPSIENRTCPLWAIFYGHITDNKIDNLTTNFCTPYLERINVKASFNLPDFSISQAPVIASPPEFFSDWSDTSISFQVLNITDTNDVLDNTMNAIIYGKDGIPPAELLDNNRLVSAYTHIYRQYVAQEVNSFFRSAIADLPKNQTNVPGTLNATYINPNHQRLFLTHTSTRLMQALLATLVICAVTIFFLIDMRQVLPKPVGSIAAVASLLADSRLLAEKARLVPAGAEWWSDKEWEKRGVWDGEVFRMGWWDQDETTHSTAYNGAAASGEKAFRIDSRPKRYA